MSDSLAASITARGGGNASQPSQKKRWRFLHHLFPPVYPLNNNNSPTTTSGQKQKHLQQQQQQRTAATHKKKLSTFFNQQPTTNDEALTTTKASTTKKTHHQQSIILLLRALFFHHLSQNQFQKALGILCQMSLISTTMSKSEHAHTMSGGLLSETIPLKELFLAMYRKGAIGAKTVENFFVNTFHQDASHAHIYLKLLVEWGKVTEAIKLYQEGPRHFHPSSHGLLTKLNRRKNRRKNDEKLEFDHYRDMILFFEQEIAYLKLLELDHLYLNFGELPSDKLLYTYEMIKPLDFVSEWHRVKSLILFGQISLAQRVLVRYCVDHGEDTIAWQVLLQFLMNRRVVETSVRPVYVPEVDPRVVDEEKKRFERNQREKQSMGDDDEPFLEEDDDDMNGGQNGGEDFGQKKQKSDNGDDAEDKELMDQVVDRLLDLDPVNTVALGLIQTQVSKNYKHHHHHQHEHEPKQELKHEPKQEQKHEQMMDDDNGVDNDDDDDHDDERSWNMFGRLWDAIQVCDGDEYWISLVKIASIEYGSDPGFTSFVQQYCSSFLQFIPIHLSIFEQLREEKNLVSSKQQTPGGDGKRKKRQQHRNHLHYRHRSMSKQRLRMIMYRAIILILVLDQVEDRSTFSLISFGMSQLSMEDEPANSPLRILFKQMQEEL